MNERKVPFLCGGVFFFLLTQATLPNGSARDHRDGNKDEHSEPVLMTDLIYTFTGCQDYGSKKDTSKYKDCLLEGSCNLPFNDIAVCTTYDNIVTGNYRGALSRMDEFVRWHLNPEMREWLMKALIEILENDALLKTLDGQQDRLEERLEVLASQVPEDGEPMNTTVVDEVGSTQVITSEMDEAAFLRSQIVEIRRRKDALYAERAEQANREVQIRLLLELVDEMVKNSLPGCRKGCWTRTGGWRLSTTTWSSATWTGWS